MGEITKGLSELLTALGLPAPFTLAVVLLVVSAREFLKQRIAERELRRKEIVGSLQILKKWSSETSSETRDLLIDQVEREEFLRTTGLSIAAKVHRTALFAFVRTHPDDVSWRTLKSSTEFWKVRESEVVLKNAPVTWLLYWAARIFGWACQILMWLSFVLAMERLTVPGSKEPAISFMIIGFEAFVIWIAIAVSFGLPLLCRTRIERALFPGRTFCDRLVIALRNGYKRMLFWRWMCRSRSHPRVAQPPPRTLPP